MNKFKHDIYPLVGCAGISCLVAWVAVALVQHPVLFLSGAALVVLACALDQ